YPLGRARALRCFRVERRSTRKALRWLGPASNWVESQLFRERRDSAKRRALRGLGPAPSPLSKSRLSQSRATIAVCQRLAPTQVAAFSKPCNRQGSPRSGRPWFGPRFAVVPAWPRRRLHAANRYDRVTHNVEAITGRPATSARDFVARHAESFAP